MFDIVDRVVGREAQAGPCSKVDFGVAVSIGFVGISFGGQESTHCAYCE